LKLLFAPYFIQSSPDIPYLYTSNGLVKEDRLKRES
jgi:hypothetical protein